MAELKSFEVSLPISGVAYLTIEAETAEQAIDKAMDEVRLEHVEEWSSHHQIVRGNIFCGILNEASAE